jgi:Mg2+-importing ATPase
VPRLEAASANAGVAAVLAASIGTQRLIIYVIRTRRIPLRSRPSRPMMIVPVAAAAISIVLPFTPLRHVLRFASLPARFSPGSPR